MAPRLVLASASPARLRALRDAGLAVEVVVSGVDEGGIDALSPAEAVVALARRKATAVAARLAAEKDPVLVLGCDSMLEIEGRTLGKPSSAEEATALWRRRRGKAGVFHTGHCVIDVATGASASESAGALVRFGEPTDHEIAAYVATGEPLQAAGGFTLEGYGAPWVETIEGGYGTVMGVSLPVVRRLLGRMDVELVDLWADPIR